MLETFGVSIGSEAVYRAMLQHPDQDLEGLALTLGRRVEEVRAALDDLADLALVDHEAPGPGGYCAIPPEQAIELLIAREEQQLEDRRARLADSRTSIPDLVQDYVSNRRRLLSSEIELLEDSRLVRSRLFQLSADATTSVCNSSPGGALPEHAVAAALRLDADVAARGVRCRMLVARSSLGAPYWGSYLQDLIRLGHQVRTHESLPQLCIVIDETTAVIPAGRDGAPGSAYVLHGRGLVAPVQALFDELWGVGLPFVEGCGDGTEKAVSEDRMREVVTLLARGLKDDAIARRLGVSVRTVRRLISATIDDLQADSRFQAGVVAVQRGWVAGASEPPRR